MWYFIDSLTNEIIDGQSVDTSDSRVSHAFFECDLLTTVLVDNLSRLVDVEMLVCLYSHSYKNLVSASA